MHSRYYGGVLGAQREESARAHGASNCKRPAAGTQIRTVLKSGDSFGEEVALGVSADYRVTVSAIEPCQLFLIEKARDDTDTRRHETQVYTYRDKTNSNMSSTLTPSTRRSPPEKQTFHDDVCSVLL